MWTNNFLADVHLLVKVSVHQNIRSIYLAWKSLLPARIFYWTFFNLKKKVNPWNIPKLDLKHSLQSPPRLSAVMDTSLLLAHASVIHDYVHIVSVSTHTLNNAPGSSYQWSSYIWHTAMPSPECICICTHTKHKHTHWLATSLIKSMTVCLTEPLKWDLSSSPVSVLFSQIKTRIV